MPPAHHRYCMKCGSRLSRETKASMCAPCRQVSGIGSDQAPDLGAHFWYTDQMRDAFASRDMGTVVRTYRYHPAHGHKALPQEMVSRWLSVTQSQLSRIESGRNHVDTLDKLIHYARTLKMPADLLWFSFPDDNDGEPRRGSGGVLALPDGPLVSATSVNTDSALANSLLDTLDLYVKTDNLAGPQSLLSIAPEQLRFVEDLLESARGRDRAQLLVVAGRYAEFAGWIYQDSGSLNSAMQMSSIALDFAEEAEDNRLVSYVLMRRSNVATDAKRPGLALKLADAALARAQDLAQRYRAVALRQRAHAFAQLDDMEGCARALDLAHELAQDSSDTEGDLAHYCTPEYVEMEAANCWVELERPEQAISTLQKSLSEWKPEFRRDLGLALARLAVAHASVDEVDNALIVADRSFDIAKETKSHRIADQLTKIPGRVTEQGAEEEASKFRQRLRHLLKS